MAFGMGTLGLRRLGVGSEVLCEALSRKESKHGGGGGCRQEGEVQGEQRVDPLAAWVDLGRTEMVVGLSALETEGDKSWNGIRETEI